MTKQSPKLLPPRNSTFASDNRDQEDDGWGASAGVRILVYGRSGTGKTTFCSTMPGKLLWLLCSGGNKPGELKSIDTPENRKRITPRIIKDTDQMRELIDGSLGTYDGYVLDHATGFADLILKEILGLKEVPVQKGWGTASQQQYGTQSLQCKTWFRELLNLPGNVAVIAHEKSFGGEGDNSLVIPTVGAALTPSVTGWLNGACDYVVQTFIRTKMEEVTALIGGKPKTTLKATKQREYCLRTEPHDVFQTKFRIPRGRELPECIVDPTFDKMMAIIRGE